MIFKIITRVLIAALLGLCVFLFFYKFIHPQFIREVVRLNENKELVRYFSGKERLRWSKEKGKKNLSAKYDRISIPESDDTLAIFFQNGLRGFISLRSGKVVIAAKFTHAYHFSENLAVVSNLENKLGVIDRKGEIKVPFKYSFIQHFTDYGDDPLYSFSNGLCIITDNDNFGLIDSSGIEKLAPVYEKIKIETTGYYTTLLDNKWGLFDNSFSSILGNEYQSISVLESGIIVSKDGLDYLLSFDGKQKKGNSICSNAFPLQYVSSESEDYTSSEDSYSDAKSCPGWTVIKKENGVGLMRNSDRKLIINCQYSAIKALSDNLFRCKLDDESYVIYDQNGNIVHF